VSIRCKVSGLLAVLCVGLIAAACVPAKQPAQEPPPQEPPPAPDSPHPPDQGPPPNSPTLTTTTNFVPGLTNPWDMAFLSDGTMFFTQRSGPVEVRLTNGTINTIVTPSDVSSGGAAGMMGIAVDPAFAMNPASVTNRFIYTCYTTANDIRIVKWSVNPLLNGVVPPGTGTPIVQGISTGGDHFGCRTRFGPDGKLWFTIGDGATGTWPQDLSVLNGKTMRINSDGSAPSDNPFAGQPGIDDRIFTYGHRNQQGIAFRPGTGEPYTAEHGPDINDEVNRLVPGGNGGWDPVPGYDQSVPMTDLQKFPDAMIPTWRSGDSFTLAPSGCTFLTGAQWKSWNGALVVAFLKDGKARVMFLNGSGDVSSATPILEFGIRLRSAVQGPDGNLYISTDNGGGSDAIWKVVPS
jgi:aldose sugar dehydrogenase